MQQGIPDGLTEKLTITYAEDKDGGKGKGKDGKGGKGDLTVAAVEASDNLFVRGLPGDTTEEALRGLFGPFGNVTSIKLLPLKDDAAWKPPHQQKLNGFVRMSSVDEAKKAIEGLDEQTPPGQWYPISVKFAGDGVPVVTQIRKKMDYGDKLYFGTVRSWDSEKKSGFIACDEIFSLTGGEVYAHQSCLERGGCVPGDAVVFFVNWKGDNPQALSPIMRVAAECTETEKKYALRGWFKGIANEEKGFGFIECPDIKALLDSDIYAAKDVTDEVRPGWVSFNIRLTINKDGYSWRPMAVQMEACDKEWRPTPSVLGESREVTVPGAGKGGKGGGKKGGGKAWDAWSAMMWE